MRVFPCVTRSRKRFIKHILEKNPDLDIEGQNQVIAHIMMADHEAHYLEDMILINMMSPRIILHEISHHIFWKLYCPYFFHKYLDTLDIVLRRRK